MNNRLDRLTQWLKEKELDFAFIHSPSNVFYLTDFQCTPHERLLGLVIFPEKEPFLVCPKLEADRARKSGWSGEIVANSDTDDPWENIRQAFQRRGIREARSAAVEKSELSLARAEKLQHVFPATTFIDTEEILGELRLVKDESEMKRMREAAHLADAAVQIGVEAICEGKTEMEILAEIEYGMKKKGVSAMAFSTMVLTGDNAAQPHGIPGNRQVQKGDFVLFDLGVVVDGYCSDITRTVAFDHVDDEKRKIYNTVLQAQEAAVAAGKPGTRIGDLDRIAREIIQVAGYGEFFTHRIGHGLGIETHEAPSMSENNQGLLKQGMVYTIEPGIYVPGSAGVRIEDDVYITKDGHECLTKYPKELQIVK